MKVVSGGVFPRLGKQATLNPRTVPLTVSAEHPVRDDDLLDLVRALVEPEDPRVPPVALDVEVATESAAALGYTAARNSSGSTPASRMMRLSSPVPMSSPRCTGTTVARPLACLRNTWLPD